MIVSAKVRTGHDYIIDDQGRVRFFHLRLEDVTHASLEIKPDEVIARWQYPDSQLNNSLECEQIDCIKTDEKGSHAVCFLDPTSTRAKERPERTCTYRARLSFVSGYFNTGCPVGSTGWLRPPGTTVRPSTDQESAESELGSSKGEPEVLGPS